MASMADLANEWYSWAQAQVQARLSINGPGVKLTLPPRSFFQFPPSHLPATLQPPVETPNYEPLFLIPSDWYNAALSPAVPITFALVYATAITFLNSVNKRRGLKPWAISKTYTFKLFVISHNIFLSAYSLWTFVGMINTLRVSLANPQEYGLAATIDSFCKLHGPRGHGSAATYNETTGEWAFTDKAFHLLKDTLNPDSTDVGRIWNEGLSFYGWLFYISKFYEVVDTLIIIAKGKKSSFLQTYHHAGAMLCMWAGIRYMSPPIWMFVTVNSFIHTIMYTFYTVTTVGVRVPKWLKQTLTTLQITQFVIGASFAFAHYFVAYQIPVSVSYIFHLGEALLDATPSIEKDVSSAVSVATATASADIASWLKKLALRAAGREGLAENVENQLGQTFGIDAVHAVQDFVAREETRYRDELQWVNCLDTSGQTFAIYLNIFYLAPLTWLFLRFFFKSYIKRTVERRRSSVTQLAYIASQSINDARKGVGRDLSEAFEDYQGANGNFHGRGDVVDAEEVRRDLRDLVQKAKEEGHDVSEAVMDPSVNTPPLRVSEQTPLQPEEVKTGGGIDVPKVEEDVAGVTSTARETLEQATKSKVGDTVQAATKSVENLSTENITSEIADTAAKFQDRAEELAAEMRAELPVATHPVEDVAEGVRNLAEPAVQKVEEGVEAVAEHARDMVEPLSSDMPEKIEQAVETTQDRAEPLIHKAEEGVKEVVEDVQDKSEPLVQKIQGSQEEAAQETHEETPEIEKKLEESQEKTTEASDEVPEVKDEVPGVGEEVSKAKEEAPKVEESPSVVKEEIAESLGEDATPVHGTAFVATDSSAQPVPEPESSGDTAPPPGHTFADVAAEGVTEEDKDQAGVIALDSDDGEDTTAPKEKDAEGA